MVEADDVRPLLIYPDESAGGLMTTSFITLRPAMTAQDAITALRDWDHNDELPYYLFVVDGERHLKGVVGLRPLVTAPGNKAIHELMSPDVITVPVGTDQEECARLLKKYGFLALPVVDAEQRLLGVITNDDLMDVAEEEAVEDTFRLSGVSDEESVFSPVRASMRKRMPWLAINLFTAFFASWVASRFEGTVQQLTVLAFLQSIAAGQGGNAATQRIAIVVRGLATGDLDWDDTPRLLGKEVWLGLLQGLVIGLLVGTGILIWQRNMALAAVMGIAMIGNMVVAGLVGAFVPVLLHRLKLDPALASAVIVTTFTDACGFAFTLGIATLALRWLQ
jgi:magnesium transporter